MSERSRQPAAATDTREDGYDESSKQGMTSERRESGGVTTSDMAAAMEKRQETETTTAGRRDGPDNRPAPLFPGNESETFRSRWSEIQTGFVDEPRRAVESADGLVAEVVQRLVQTFADERNRLEKQWGEGADVSTEDLRVALQRYRSFFERLLAT